MIVVTTENVPGYRVKETKGQVFGVIVRSRGFGGNMVASLRSIIGGEIPEYTQLLEDARRNALDRMVMNASMMGANGIAMMRYDSAEIGQSMSEIVAYGTAVVLEPVAAAKPEYPPSSRQGASAVEREDLRSLTAQDFAANS